MVDDLLSHEYFYESKLYAKCIRNDRGGDEKLSNDRILRCMHTLLLIHYSVYNNYASILEYPLSSPLGDWLHLTISLCSVHTINITTDA